mgnify:CR=1 FL=1
MRFSVVAKKAGTSEKTKKDWYCLVIFDNLCTVLSVCYVKEVTYEAYDINDNVDDKVTFLYDKQTSSYVLRIF